MEAHGVVIGAIRLPWVCPATFPEVVVELLAVKGLIAYVIFKEEVSVSAIAAAPDDVTDFAAVVRTIPTVEVKLFAVKVCGALRIMDPAFKHLFRGDARQPIACGDPAAGFAGAQWAAAFGDHPALVITPSRVRATVR